MRERSVLTLRGSSSGTLCFCSYSHHLNVGVVCRIALHLLMTVCAYEVIVLSWCIYGFVYCESIMCFCWHATTLATCCASVTYWNRIGIRGKCRTGFDCMHGITQESSQECELRLNRLSFDFMLTFWLLVIDLCFIHSFHTAGDFYENMSIILISCLCDKAHVWLTLIWETIIVIITDQCYFYNIKIL